MGMITHLRDDGHVSLQMDSGKNVEVSLASFRHIDHGYAVTSHSSQGATTDPVLLHVNVAPLEFRILPWFD
jgi:ATP-dependent exoDNAse (exonuclease V) alpha subunit